MGKVTVFDRSNQFWQCARIACATAAFAMLGACSQYSDVTPSQLQANPQAQELARQRVYRLGVGDNLEIRVFSEAELSGKHEIDALGQISMPLIGSVKAKGHTVESLRRNITSRLANGYLKEPRVAVTVTNYRPFFVHGEVRQGGEFEFKNGLTIRDAVAKAGGYSYRANTSYVLVRHEGEQHARRVNLPTLMNVLPGDNIRIPERWF